VVRLAGLEPAAHGLGNRYTNPHFPTKALQILSFAKFFQNRKLPEIINDS
jgi:hypothetical protein